MYVAETTRRYPVGQLPLGTDWQSAESEPCIVVSDDGVKRRQQALKPRY
jgi:hypothetical protein